MASVSRQDVDMALFDLLRRNLPSNVRTVSRRLKGWDEISPSEQPAVFLVKRGEHISRQRGLPAVNTAKYDIVIYVNTGGDMKVCSADLLNPILDSVCDSLESSDYTGLQNLGLPDSVSHAYIDGEVFTDEGFLGEQALAVIPIEVLWL